MVGKGVYPCTGKGENSVGALSQTKANAVCVVWIFIYSCSVELNKLCCGLREKSERKMP